MFVRNASAAGNTQNLQSASIPAIDASADNETTAVCGIKLQQYNASSTLIPEGTRIKLYGIRK